MSAEEILPSESEWAIMEILWEEGSDLTSSEIIKRLQGNMAPKMVRVLLNRLHKKKLVGYLSDKKDARVYHYYPLKTREECLREKSRKFVDSYFSGNGVSAFATFLRSLTLTKDQIQELEGILEQSKEEEEGTGKH